MPAPPRYVPDLPLPPYAYVPGLNPHPERDPDGHGFSPDSVVPLAADIQNLHENRHYLAGIDLFNHGYYWEAHEYWEMLWKASGHRSVTANFLKGLIKLAAAAVKLLEGNSRGSRRHADKARSLFYHLSTQHNIIKPGGLHLNDLIILCNHIEQTATDDQSPSELPAQNLFKNYLLPN